jgi:hypothetical protein
MEDADRLAQVHLRTAPHRLRVRRVGACTPRGAVDTRGVDGENVLRLAVANHIAFEVTLVPAEDAGELAARMGGGIALR